MKFSDRHHAGQELGQKLKAELIHQPDIILALPRGGVPVAFEVAKLFTKPMDVFVVRKLGAPHREELAIGALAPDESPLLNQQLIERLQVTPDEIERIVDREKIEMRRRNAAYRASSKKLDLTGKHVLLIDDGLATGASMKAACLAAKQMGAKTITAGVPVAPAETCEALSRMIDQVICMATPEPFLSVGLWYADFTQTTDEEVLQILGESRSREFFTAS